jgi:hypothetical protein
MKKYIHQIILISAVGLLASCTKVIDLKLGNASNQLVIEGNITNVNGQQRVVLNKNVPFGNTNTYPPVTGATVTISDQAGNSFSLVETTPGNYTIDNLSGVRGTTYTLTVSTGGQTYHASSTMPAPVVLDSLTDKNSPFDDSSNGKDKKTITVHYKDPAGIANQYRYVMWVKGVQVKDIFAYDDEFTDGRNVAEDLMESDIDIYAGDTVKVEMQCIDEPVYKYWFALESQQANGLGGATAPANPPSDILPAALGYFSAHTTQSLTIIVK